MALWTKAQQLPESALNQIKTVYNDRFPIEVRHFLAQWIDDRIQMWLNDLDPDNVQHEGCINTLIASLIQELESKASTMTSPELFITRMKLIDVASKFRQCNTLTLFRMVKYCLSTEIRLVQQLESGTINQGVADCQLPVTNSAYMEINQRMEVLRLQTHENNEEIRKLDTDQESLSLKWHDRTKIEVQLQHLRQMQCGQPLDTQNRDRLMIINTMERQKANLEAALPEKVANLRKLLVHIVERISDKYIKVSNLQQRILDVELLSWKRNQQLAGNGFHFDPSHLDVIQTWCEGLAEIIWCNRTQVKETERLRALIAQYRDTELGTVKSNLFDLNHKFTELLSSLVTSTFIIEKQPPQVMKTNTRFSAKIRLLVGGKLNVHMTPPQVKVSIISEVQANYLLTEKAIKGDVSGDILNNVGTMEYDQTTKHLSITFRNMQLKKIKRAEKKGSESVVDEKFSLYFSSQFSIGAGELVFQVWTLSLPVAVIVHGNQEPHAWATITWDNAFAESGRKPFVVPEKVPWGKVAQALNVKFDCATGRALSASNIKYLAEKVLRTTSDDLDSRLLSWTQFSKESLSERNFTFWDWFYAIMKLTREHLKSIWMDGSIHGFVQKRQAEEMLANSPSGTFLLRFSDSELGGVTIAWVGETNREVFMLQPFTAKDFAIRTLPDRLSDLHYLHYLYPDIPKEKAFGRYYTPYTDTRPNSSSGYVKPLLVMDVPGWGGSNTNTNSRISQGGMNSYPATPHSMFHPHSPGDSVSVMSEPAASYGITYSGNNDMDTFTDFFPEMDTDNLSFPGL